MKYALFLGCTIPGRARNYELSARRVADRLGIDLVDVPEFICCGFPMKNIDRDAADVLAAYNLGLAQQRGLAVCTLCSSCTSALTEASRHLAADRASRKRVNESLARAGLQYRSEVKVRHFARILLEEVGAEKIREQVVRDLGDLKIAIHYGCHYLKPSEVFDGFDEVENPASIDLLLAATGARVVDYPGRKRCCGGPVLPVDQKVALALTRQKLDDIRDAGAAALCLVCPFCAVMYDGNQKSIEAQTGASYNLPVLYLSQLLGLALGFDRKELGLNMNVVKTKQLLARYFGEGSD